ncbi:hypothetical protein D210916BOD24_12940 [Alteromonas sp. D210916BOD_24]|uniref:hypothetical protein n=1 Tax=Alteromonas sp. D210916BOD_24 TaxID=3157618 RepID=UPI00399C6A2E
MSELPVSTPESESHSIVIKHAAVMTGDIAQSQSLSNTAFSAVVATLKKQLQNNANLYNGSYDIYRGDAFQLVTSQPNNAMNIAVGLRLALKAHSPSTDVRISVALGEAVFRTEEVRTGSGTAFVMSGRGLDSIKPQHIAFQSDNLILNQQTQLLTRFLDVHLTGLTQIQSETLLAYLLSEDKSHDSVADRLGKSRSNVSRILNASQYKLVVEYLSYMEEAITTAINNGKGCDSGKLTDSKDE